MMVNVSPRPSAEMRFSVVREIIVALFVGVPSALAPVPAFRCELGEHADTYFPQDAEQEKRLAPLPQADRDVGNLREPSMDTSCFHISMNRLMLAIIALTIICLVAWGLPVVTGRLGYTQFTFAMVATVIWGSLVAVRLCPPQRRRTVIFRLLAIWLGISVGLGIAELAALAWPTDHLADNPWYMSTGEALVADNDLPWVRPANLDWTGSSRGDLAIETNSADPDARLVTFQTDFQGFRNSRDLTEAEIVFIGDSFTEAGNVPEEETFVSLTGSALRVVVRNMGVAGYGPPAELVALQKFGLQCKPRVVVWQIAETNDLDDAVFFVQWYQAGRPSVLPGFSKAKPTHLEAWRRRSPSRLLWTLLRREQPWPFSGDFIDGNGNQHTLRFEMSFPPNARAHPGWPIVEYTLTSGAKILNEQNIQLVVLLIPRKLRVMAPSTDFHEIELSDQGRPTIVKHSLPAGWDQPPDARLATYLQRLCSQLSVTFIDTTERLTAAASAGELVYQSMDTHLSPRGHQIVADMLVQTLDKSEAQ